MKSTLRRTWAEIDLDALKHNYMTLRERVGEDVKFLGVVKADAYGHGSIQTARVLEEMGADYLAVSSNDEAMELRTNGIKMPLMILGHTPREQVDLMIDNDITQTVTCRAKAVEYSEEATRLGKTLRVHIKVDTGMSRLGYLCDEDYFGTGVEGIVEACQMPGLQVEGIFTHFAMSDEDAKECCDYTKRQLSLFKEVIAETEKKLGRKFEICHCANTGAVANYPESWMDMVRPGLLLYGYGQFAERLGLKPVMTMKTTVSTIKIYPEGTLISYGGTYETTGATTRVGVLPYGYADGFLRCLSNKVELMTDEGPAQQLGRICMDMSMVDLTDKMSVEVGSEIEIFGPNNSINRVAELAGTIPYELTCAVSKRVPRFYFENGEMIERELMLRG